MLDRFTWELQHLFLERSAVMPAVSRRALPRCRFLPDTGELVTSVTLT